MVALGQQSRHEMTNRAVTPALKRLNNYLILGAVLLFAGCPVFGEGFKVLPGHVPPGVPALISKGRLPATNQLRLAIGLPMRDRAGLDNFVAQVSDPANPNFRHFLTREQLTARFGPTPQDYEAVKEFAVANGLAIAATGANRLLLEVTGPAASMEKAFHITLRTYRHPTEARDFFAPDTEPAVDAALPVADIQGLTDYWLPRPRLMRKMTDATPKSGTAPDGSGNLFGDDFRRAYVPGTTLTGARQSVGVLEFSAYYPSDISNYANQAGNGRTNTVIEPVLLGGFNGVPPISGYGVAEAEADMEMAMAMAPGLAKIVVFEENTNGTPNIILNAMLADSNVLNLSCSWGWGGQSPTTDAIFESMDAVGQSFFNASGDVGAFTSGQYSINGVDNPATYNAPSSNPYITQVGGTTLVMNAAGASWASEVVWNWGRDPQGNYFSGNSGASSGGISSYYPIPSWQTNVSSMSASGGSTGFRNIPDVAANANNAYVIANDGKATGSYAGTSCAAPLWAGFMALVNQQEASNGTASAGFINPVIYALALESNYAGCFHDITSGSNVWSRSPDSFFAADNYDLCTGLGTMYGTNLIAVLAPPLPAPTILSCAFGGGAFAINWSTVPGNVYQVQYTSDLAATNWIDDGPAILAAAPVNVLTDVVTNSSRFYRVVLMRQ
jgi:subtilase family serine protease